MALKKSELYSSLWASCDELRGGMDASPGAKRIASDDRILIRQRNMCRLGNETNVIP